MRVALPVPMRSEFDYLSDNQLIVIGVRVWVPFGNRRLVGLVTGLPNQSELDADKLKKVLEVLDDKPVMAASMLHMCQWLSRYYHFPLGQVIHAALPVHLRQGKANTPAQQTYWQTTELGQTASAVDFGRAKKQWALLSQLQQGELTEEAVQDVASKSVLKGLTDKGFIIKRQRAQEGDTTWQSKIRLAAKPVANIQQSLAISAIANDLDAYAVHLLEGVTGSGKTEVYLQVIEPVLLAGKQVLILVPEIGLTPQTVVRFEQRFGLPVALLHSNVNDGQRLRIWQQAKAGEVGIVIGTRSAIFTPFAQLGMLIVDEEHDLSYKQQDGLRYQARDLAVIRAKQENIPLLLGSATPSLESLNNAINRRYHYHQLTERAGFGLNTSQHLLDLRNQQTSYGLAHDLLNRIKHHLSQGNQVLIFANRRGYAPALICHSCGYVHQCNRCDRPFTWHRSSNKLECHHCGNSIRKPASCAQCGSQALLGEGMGTEQVEMGLSQLYPEFSVKRVDSDAIRGKGKLETVIHEINQKKHQILVGTQILSKGHHFPHVTLVAIMDVDAALYSADYRAAEHLAQLITQLSGRAGRADKPGEMWLQTHEPGHPLLQDLLNNGYQHFARYALLERKHALLPPWHHQALFRAEANWADAAYQFLHQIRQLLKDCTSIDMVGPLPALMEKRQGRFRFQLLLQSAHRAAIQQLLGDSIHQIEALPTANKVRWSLDVDPQDFS